MATLADPNELFLPGDRQNNLAMSSSVPLLRAPVPGNRSTNGSPRTPKLTLGIPPSPNAKPVNGNGAPVAPPALQLQPPQQSSRPAPPQLRLATPMNNQNGLQQKAAGPRGRPSLPTLSTGGLGVNGQPALNGRGSGPGSAAPSYSTIGVAQRLREPDGTSSPSSAISEAGVPIQQDASVNSLLPDLDKLSLEKGRPLDVEDLDDEGWHAASEQKKIVELGSLGEGAGGAVTRCKLKDGKTVFALKVRHTTLSALIDIY